jgi:hypothetical protein
MSPRPYLSSYRDRHGRLRWRFRRAGRTIQIHGQPGEPAFEAAYAAALAGQGPATVVKIGSSHIKPRTFKAAWRLVVRTPEWMALRASSREQYIERAERLLAMELPGVPGVTYADAPVVDMRRRHVRELLASMADRPHAAYDTLVVLRKMIAVALDEEWIDVDPTHRVRYRPETDGHRAGDEGRNPGAIYVKAAGEYAGKIVEGRFSPTREARQDEALIGELRAIFADPAAAAKAHGKETGSCSCCGRELTDPASIEAGIGPICAGRFAF